MSRLNTIARRLAFGALVSACSFGVFAETSPITDEQKKNADRAGSGFTTGAW